MRSPIVRVFPSRAASLKSPTCPSCCHLPNETSNDRAVIYSRSFSPRLFCPAQLIHSCSSSSIFPPSPLSIIPIGYPIGCSPDPAGKAFLLPKSRIFGDKHKRTVTCFPTPFPLGWGRKVVDSTGCSSIPVPSRAGEQHLWPLSRCSGGCCHLVPISGAGCRQLSSI